MLHILSEGYVPSLHSFSCGTFKVLPIFSNRLSAYFADIEIGVFHALSTMVLGLPAGHSR